MLSPLKYTRNLPTLIVTFNILLTTLNNRSWLLLTLFITEFLILTDPTEVQKARKDVCVTLQANGFPYKHTYPTKPKPLQDSPTFTGYTSLPYIQGTTEKMRRVLKLV